MSAKSYFKVRAYKVGLELKVDWLEPDDLEGWRQSNAASSSSNFDVDAFRRFLLSPFSLGKTSPDLSIVSLICSHYIQLTFYRVLIEANTWKVVIRAQLVLGSFPYVLLLLSPYDRLPTCQISYLSHSSSFFLLLVAVSSFFWEIQPDRDSNPYLFFWPSEG